MKKKLKSDGQSLLLQSLSISKKWVCQKQLSIIEDKVKDNRRIAVLDELTLIFATLSVKDSEKENMIKRVCCILDEIDYIDKSRREVIDSLISFQIENFVKSEIDKNKLNKVGYKEGYDEIRKEIALKMMEDSIDDETIQYAPDFQPNSFKNPTAKLQFPVSYIESSLSTVSASIGLLSLRMFLTTGNLNE